MAEGERVLNILHSLLKIKEILLNILNKIILHCFILHSFYIYDIWYTLILS